LYYLRNGDLIPFTLQYGTENVHKLYRIKVISIHVLHLHTLIWFYKFNTQTIL